MCYPFFSLLSFCYRAYWSVNPWGTCFTWSFPRQVAFQFNQETSWLLRYRHLAFSRFISLRQTTHESKISLGLKDSDIIHKILEQATPFFPLIPSTWNSNLKILATTGLQQIYRTVNSFIELLLTVCPKQSVTQLGWISVLISRQPVIRPKTET